MARLEKFRGADRLPGVRRPAVSADTAVGTATRGLGAQIRQAADRVGQLGRLLARGQAQVDRQEQEIAVRRFEDRLAQRRELERQAERPGAVGFTEVMLRHFDQERQSALNGQPDRLRAGLAEVLDQRRNRHAQHFATVEFNDNRQYFRDGLEESLQARLAQVAEAPGTAPAALAAMVDLIDNAPLAEQERAALRQAGAVSIGETFANSLPPEDRLGVLDGLEAQDGGDADRGAAASGIDAELLALLQHLPADSRDRLRADAQDTLRTAELLESEEIAERLRTEGAAFDAETLEQARFLSPRRKKDFERRLQDRRRQDAEERAALDWAKAPRAGSPYSEEDRWRADTAYARLSAQGVRPEIAARALLRDKRVFPDAHARRLLNDLGSPQEARVQAAFEDLEAVHEIDAMSVEAGPLGRRLQDKLTQWRILTETQGGTAKEAVRTLAAANDPEVRGRLAAGAGPVPARSAEDVLDRLTGPPAVYRLG